MKKQIALILTTLILLFQLPCTNAISSGAVEDECDFYIKSIISYEMHCDVTDVDHDLLQLWADTVLPLQVNGTGEWYVMALSHYHPSVDFGIFR